MELFVNNKSYEINDCSSLKDLLSSVKIECEEGVAVALNNKVVCRDTWSSVILSSNDNIMILEAIQGG